LSAKDSFDDLQKAYEGAAVTGFYTRLDGLRWAMPSRDKSSGEYRVTAPDKLLSYKEWNRLRCLLEITLWCLQSPPIYKGKDPRNLSTLIDGIAVASLKGENTKAYSG